MPKPFYQQVKDKYFLGPVSHITHISNLEGIITNGILSHNKMKQLSYFNLSDTSVQQGRQNKVESIYGKSLHDYVPLYFGSKTPMVIQHQDKNRDLIYLRFSFEIIQTERAVLTDGNARSKSTLFFPFTNIDDLKKLDSHSINSDKWVGEPEKKRRKQAEILISDKINFSQVFDILCVSKNTQNRVVDILEKQGIKKLVHVSRSWFFIPKGK